MTGGPVTRSHYAVKLVVLAKETVQQARDGPTCLVQREGAGPARLDAVVSAGVADLMVQERAQVSQLMVVVRPGVADLLIKRVARCSRHHTCPRERDTALDDCGTCDECDPRQRTVNAAFAIHGHNSLFL